MDPAVKTVGGRRTVAPREQRSIGAWSGSLGVYDGALGVDADELAPIVRRLHCDGGPTFAVGDVSVRRGRGPFAAVVARLLRLPAAGSTIPLALLIDRTGGCETWLRTFASRRHLVTQQSVRPDGRIEERVGPARLVLEASAVDGALVVRQVGLAVRLGVVWVRVPARFALQATARAAPARDGGVAVCVRITFPGGALVGSYAGIVALGTRP